MRTQLGIQNLSSIQVSLRIYITSFWTANPELSDRLEISHFWPILPTWISEFVDEMSSNNECHLYKFVFLQTYCTFWLCPIKSYIICLLNNSISYYKKNIFFVVFRPPRVRRNQIRRCWTTAPTGPSSARTKSSTSSSRAWARSGHPLHQSPLSILCM